MDVDGDTSLEDCTIRDGKFGGMASSGNLCTKNCLLDDNGVEMWSASVAGGEVGVEVQDGSASFEKTYICPL